MRELVLAGGALAATACSDSGHLARPGAADGGSAGDGSTGGTSDAGTAPDTSFNQCCNASSDPCCMFEYCGASLTPDCACELDGGTWNYSANGGACESTLEAGSADAGADVDAHD